MRDISHKTWITTIQQHVTNWRQSNQWSRETVIQEIVEAHERIGGPARTGIDFEPGSKDAYNRMKANADRVLRWLDDVTKDNNLLPSNFIPSILAAMPADVRLHCLEDMLRPLGLGVRSLSAIDTQGLNAVGLLCDMLQENSEAQQAVAALVDGATHAELLTAQRELSESVEATQKSLMAIESAIASIKP